MDPTGSTGWILGVRDEKWQRTAIVKNLLLTNFSPHSRENGCLWDSATCECAAMGGGHLHILQWAIANGCEWDEETCVYAAIGGQLRTLQWAREQGCPWNSDTYTEAIRYKHIVLADWATANGCPRRVG